MSRSAVVVVRADADQDDCLAAAADTYVAEHPELSGWELDPRWRDEGTREEIALTVPGWHLDELAARAERDE